MQLMIRRTSYGYLLHENLIIVIFFFFFSSSFQQAEQNLPPISLTRSLTQPTPPFLPSTPPIPL